MHFIAHDVRTNDEATSSASPSPSSASRTVTPNQTTPRSPISEIRTVARLLRWILLDIPLMVIFAMLLSSLLLQHVYKDTILPLVDSYRRGEADDDGYYSEFDFDLTYYNRQCTWQDVSTKDASDLVITPEQTGEEAANVMMDHGAVVFKNVLTQETATDLRAYLESRNEVRDTLSWHEKFWYEINRLALGLGAHDTPIITKALHEVGTHEEVKKTIEGILGPDPAIVEISTMTSMYGAKDQGIHSDSDYWGSSVLYSRNFLHSYTMFMALQDTTSKMGATTICPGTHNCANIYLGDMCMEDNNSFEVSSNGFTGVEKGVWQKGDAMMFNQNVWHRGAANRDQDNPINRVMFIVTFISRNKHTPGDRRQQALGTYYYQRWNHWGHTYSDLKNVDWLMTQPMITLRSWGIWKLSGAKWGITWLEHFARQLANDEDFYASYELPPFIDYLDSLGIPKWLQGQSNNDWELFLDTMTMHWIDFLVQANAIGHGVYLGVSLVVSAMLWLCTRKQQQHQSANGNRTASQWIPTIFKRLVITHSSVLLVFYALYLHMNDTMLARRVKSGEAFVKPFSPPMETAVRTGADASAAEAMVQDLDFGLTVFPERMDVLIGSRFDAEWLGIYNHMLDFHPGNKRFQRLLEEVADMPLAEPSKLLIRMVQDPVEAVQPRFIYQIPSNGYWMLMNDAQVLDVVSKSIRAQRNADLRSLWTEVKQIQADGRFGPLRDTKMAQRFTPAFVKRWEAILFGSMQDSNRSVAAVNNENRSTFSAVLKSDIGVVSIIKDASAPSWKTRVVPTVTALGPNTSNSKDGSSADGDEEAPIQLKLGDRVRANYKMRGKWLQGAIAGIYDSTRCLVEFDADGDYATLSNKSVQRYEPFVEGDKVDVLHSSGDWYPAKIRDIHPLGMHNIDYDDGDVDVVTTEYIRPQIFRSVVFLDDSDEARQANGENDTRMGTPTANKSAATSGDLHTDEMEEDDDDDDDEDDDDEDDDDDDDYDDDDDDDDDE